MSMSDWRTPLGRALGKGSAKEGTGHWWSQRVSAVALLLLGLWLLVALARLPGLAPGDLTNWLANPVSAILMLLLIISMAYHSDLGIRVVIEDYVHQPFAKIASIVIARFLHILVAAVAIYAVLRMAFL